MTTYFCHLGATLAIITAVCTSAFIVPQSPSSDAVAVVAAAVLSDSTFPRASQVWHARPPDIMGDEVLDLYDRLGFGGYMWFLHSHTLVQQTDAGVWELRSDKIASKIHQKADLIRESGYLMCDAEAPLNDHKNLPLYVEMLKVVRAALREEGLFDIKIGIFRVPDHVSNNVVNKFAMIPTLRHSDAVFVMVKGPGDNWVNYIEDVVQVAPQHSYVWFMDAYSRVDGQPFTQQRVLDTVRLAHGWMRNDQIVFRQQGPHVAQAIEWTLEWLGYEQSIIDPGAGADP